jgi:hypothetical protein
MELAMRTNLSTDGNESLAANASARPDEKTAGPCIRNGVPLLPHNPHGLPVTMAFVNSLRDELDQSPVCKT